MRMILGLIEKFGEEFVQNSISEIYPPFAQLDRPDSLSKIQADLLVDFFSAERIRHIEEMRGEMDRLARDHRSPVTEQEEIFIRLSSTVVTILTQATSNEPHRFEILKPSLEHLSSKKTELSQISDEQLQSMSENGRTMARITYQTLNEFLSASSMVLSKFQSGPLQQYRNEHWSVFARALNGVVDNVKENLDPWKDAFSAKLSTIEEMQGQDMPQVVTRLPVSAGKPLPPPPDYSPSPAPSVPATTASPSPSPLGGTGT